MRTKTNAQKLDLVASMMSSYMYIIAQIKSGDDILSDARWYSEIRYYIVRPYENLGWVCKFEFDIYQAAIWIPADLLSQQSKY